MFATHLTTHSQGIHVFQHRVKNYQVRLVFSRPISLKRFEMKTFCQSLSEFRDCCSVNTADHHSTVQELNEIIKRCLHELTAIIGCHQPWSDHEINNVAVQRWVGRIGQIVLWLDLGFLNLYTLKLF